MTDTRELRHDHHGCRLCVRQRAEAADRIEELEAGLEYIAAKGYTGASWVARQILTGDLNKILQVEEGCHD